MAKNIPILERAFYSDKFESLDDTKKQELIADIDKVFEENVKVLPMTEQVRVRNAYILDKETKLSEMGYDYLMPPKIETDINKDMLPQTKEEALALSQESSQQVSQMEGLEQLQAEDQTSQDQTLMMAFPLSGALHAAKGVALGSQAAARSGVAVAKSETAAEVAAQLASTGIDEFTSDEFKQANPNYYMAMQVLGTLVSAGTLGTVVYNKTIQNYDKVAKAVKDRKLTVSQADEAIQDVNKISNEKDLEEAKKFLQETAPEKVSKGVKPTENIPIEKSFEELKQHPRYDELIEMRKDVSAKDSQSPNTQISPRQIITNENLGKQGDDYTVVGATSRPNYNADFSLTKQDVKNIQAGKITPEIERKLSSDLGRLDNDPAYKEMSFEEAEKKGLIPFVAPSTLGATLGFKQNEDGTFTYDVTTGLLGAVGASVLNKALTSKQLQQFAKDTLDELPQATNRAVKKLTGVDIEPKITDGKNTAKPSKVSSTLEKTKVVDKNGKPLTVYHSTDKQFDEFDPTKSYDGGLWFTSDLDALKKGEVGASGSGRIIEAKLDVKKMAGWDEYDKYSLGELIDQGYDGVKLDDDYIVFENSQIKQIAKKPTVKKAKTESKIASGEIPEKGRVVSHPERDKDYYLGDSGKIYFKRANGKWIETKNIQIKSEIKYIAEHGKKKFVENNLLEDAKRDKAFKEAENKQAEKEDTYKMEHTAPTQANGVRADDVTDAFSDDIYSLDAVRLHGHGNKQMDEESISIINKIKNKPNAKITIYRAVPKNIDTINSKDWVTTSKLYAKEHGESNLPNGYKIIEKKVTAKELYTDGNSIHEWGYNPITKDVKLQSSPTVGSATLGATAGLEIDEDGNTSYNIAKGTLGAIGGAVAYKGGSKLYSMYKNKSPKFKGMFPSEAILPPETRGQVWQRIFQDKFNRVKQLQKVKAGKEKLNDAIDVYRAEERYSGRAQYRQDEFMKEKVDPILKFIAKKDLDLNNIDEYLHARHAIERNAQMKKVSGIENGSGMSDAEAVKIINKYKDNVPMNSVVKAINKISKDRLRLIKEEGLESEEFIADIENLYQNYVPLKRDMSDKMQQLSQPRGKGFSVKGKELKRAKGSSRKVESPFMHTILDYQTTLVRAEKNKVGQTFLKFTEQFPDKDLYEVESLKYMPRYDKDGNIKSVDPLYKEGDNIFHVKIDGKIKQIELKDEALAVALKNLNPAQMNGFTKVMHKATRFLAALNTQYNPEFVVGNFERDLQAAMINLPKEIKPKYAEFLKDVPKAIRGIYRNERGKGLTTEYQKLFEELKKEGGTTGWMEQYEVPELKADLQKTIARYQGKNIPSNAFKSVLNYIDDVNTAVENGVRLVAYKQAKEAGLTAKEAASVAKNLTVNFNRKGTAGTTINAAYMFYNASIQGSVRMIKALKDSKRAKGAVAGIAGLSYGLHQYNNMQNKEAYENIPQFEKDTNYILMNKDGSYQKVKVPYGYNVFKTAGDIIAEVQDGKLTFDEAKSRMFSTVVNAFSPIGASSDPVTTLVPTVAKPFYEMKTNENFFGGKIKPEANPFQPEKLAESHISYKSVNPVAKQFAEELNEMTGGTKHIRGEIDVSPEYIEHLFEFVGGGLAKLVSRTTTSIDKAIKGEEQDVNKVPFYRLFKGTPREKADLHLSYSIYKESSRKLLSDYKVEKFKKSINNAIKNKDIEIKKGIQLIKKFEKNQNMVKWSKENNIQNNQDEKKNINALLKMGGSSSDIKNILLKEGK